MGDDFQILLIPGPSKAHQRQVTTLDGTPYVIHFDWIQRWGRWVFGLYTTGGDALLTGQPVVVGADLLGPFRADDRMPQGVLVVLDQTGAQRDPGWADFSRAHVLLFMTDPNA